MHLDTKAKQMMLKQTVIEHKFIETVSVQRGDGARSDRGVRKKTKSFMKFLDWEGEKKRQTAPGKKKTNKKNLFTWNQIDSDGYFLYLFCTKNK